MQPLARAQDKPLVITSAVTIVESAQEPGPVHRATKDLVADFTKVFGKAPKMVDALDSSGPIALVIAQSGNVPAGLGCTTATDRESFAFSIAERGIGPTRQHVICLVGADMRGTIYAIYEFSQRVLGIDPMYLWTDKQPAKRVSIALPADFTHTYPSPVFKYRGFFPNDEDLLTGWVTPKKGEQTGIALSTWDMVFETILRLKGNMVVPGTWIFPDDAQVHAATERGLIVNQHHAIPLGVNVARWPQDVPYNFSTHPEILERAWTNAVATYKPDEEILWSVGLRGLSDSSYASLDPSVQQQRPAAWPARKRGDRGADEDRAREISQCAVRHRPMAGGRAPHAGGLPEDSARSVAGMGRHRIRRHAGWRQGGGPAKACTSTWP